MDDAHATIKSRHRELCSWLLDAAYPLWSTKGVDPAGGYFERLGQDGRPLPDKRRSRVTPRQAYCFAMGPSLGWRGDAEGLVQHGLEFWYAKFQRTDGLFRTLINADFSVADDRAVTYDQAFGLLAFSLGATLGDWRAVREREAIELLQTVIKLTKRPTGGFENGVPTSLPLESNPHMHLFEATLAGAELCTECTLWRPLADEIAEFALAHFLDGNGVLHEFFDTDWKFAPGIPGRIVEPGHQFEWAWLLLRWAGDRHPKARAAALKMIEVTEANGVKDGLALQQVLDDFSPHDPSARLWPQTERLKAAALAARLTGEKKYYAMAASAADALQRYLATPIPGLWYDRIDPNGRIIEEPAPASTFYHLVVAVAEIGALARMP
ncbi:MAG TPA: AGE family epimerase/isomerase [Steroidobacteraceae bacterium]|nr:AGE family epimerase/isomerase [Steroidobacteraceae bacterium]